MLKIEKKRFNLIARVDKVFYRVVSHPMAKLREPKFIRDFSVSGDLERLPRNEKAEFAPGA